ncbi:hypothetical protein [Geodermatophilus sp. SYSU D01176]
MRSSLSTAGRRASVLAAAALVSLTTAACGPADLQLGTAGAAGQSDTSSRTAIDPPVAIGDAATQPSDAVPTPVPTPPAPAPPTPVQTQPQTPAAGSPGSPVEDVDEPAAAFVPSHVASGVPPAAGTAGQGRRDSSSGRSTSAPAPAPAPVAAAAAPTAAGASTGGSGGAFTDQARWSFTAGNGQTGNYLLYAAGIDPAKPVGLVVYVDGTGEYGVDNPTSSYALGGSSGLVATSRARNMITLAVESPNQSCECWHSGDTGAYADFLAGLVERQLSSYPVSEVWLSGFSSGAQEITRFLVPRHPELMRLGGGWVVFGGGGPPADGGSAVTAARMAGVRGHWFTGTADTSVPLTASWGAQAGERFYAGRGVVTSSEYPAGVGHALDGRLGRTVGQLIDAS